MNHTHLTFEEQERAAYISGDTRTAGLIVQSEDLEHYKQFFEDCFEMLGAHYPCPSVTSDHDKRAIFDAIRKGEGLGDE